MKQKEQFTVYKVCEVTEDNKMVSLHAFGKAQVVYEIGKKSFPVDFTKKLGYGLFAFSNLKKAKKYSRGILIEYSNDFNNYIIILKCLTERYKYKIEKPFLSLEQLSIGKIYESNLFFQSEFPYGTVMCNWLLPIEIINIGE